MRGFPKRNPGNETTNWGRVFLIPLYALTFYFAPQFEGDPKHEIGAVRAYEADGGPSGFYWINLFNDQFNLNDF